MAGRRRDRPVSVDALAAELAAVPLADDPDGWALAAYRLAVASSELATRPEQLTEAVEDPEYGINGTVDVFVRASFMKDQVVTSPERTAAGTPLDQYTFGGNLLEVGLTLTLGWF